MPSANILNVGTELTSGITADTNAAWLARALGEVGYVVGEIAVVPDDARAVGGEIARLASSGGVLIVTGGLGPTPDDVTRDGLADAMGVPLERRDELIETIRTFFDSRGRAMPASNELQAMLPIGAEAIANPRGTAPGIVARVGGADVFVLPGVPDEMKAMFQTAVVPRLASAGAGVVRWRSLRCFGAGESDMGERLGELMARGRNPLVGITADEAVMTVRIRATAATTTEADFLLGASADAVRARLGPWVFGEGLDTLADAVARLLTQTGLSISVAESCTGGLLATRLTDVPGSSVYFRQGFVTYSNESKESVLGVPAKLIAEHGAVSGSVAEAMAVRCREIAATDIALATTGIAGPSGGSAAKPIGLVYVALADAGGATVRETRLGAHLLRDQVRDRSVKVALDWLRRTLMKRSSPE
jgi:nicotinamide-nucleotide amidase